MSNKRKHDVRSADSGFTLIEVIVAIGVLAVVATSILSFFSQSARYNAKARLTQKASLASQEVMEDIQSYADIGDMADAYVNKQSANGWKAVNSADPTTCAEDTNLTAAGVVTAGSINMANKNSYVYYFQRPVTVDGTTFTAIVTVDPTAYTGTGSKRDYANGHIPTAASSTSTVNEVEYNDIDMPELRSIYTDSNIVAVESDENEQALSRLAPSYGVADLEAAKIALRAQMTTGLAKRDIVVTIRYATKEDMTGATTVDTEYVEAEVVYHYQAKNNSGGNITVDVPVVQDEYAIDALKNVYVFYSNFCTNYFSTNPDKQDNIILKYDNAAVAGDTSRTSLIAALNKRISVYLIFTRKASSMSDAEYEAYKPVFDLDDVSSINTIADDPENPASSMVVTNAPNGVTLGTNATGLSLTNRDTNNKTYTKSDGTEQNLTGVHTGILMSQNQLVMADVTVKIYNESGSEEYQVSTTGKGE